jgi:superfamily II DNA helicase RecQ
MTSGPEPDVWLTTLAEGARLLEAGQPEEASQTLTGLLALCDLSAPRPSQIVVAQARQLLERCYQAEACLRSQVTEDLNRLASGQRAQVYRIRDQGPR